MRLGYVTKSGCSREPDRSTLRPRLCREPRMANEETRHPRLSGHSVDPSIPKLVKTTHEIAIDHTSKYDYDKLTKEEIAEYNQVEVTEDLHLGRYHAQKAWHYWFQYLAERVWNTDFAAVIVDHRRSRLVAEAPEVFRVLSLGCGHGGFELEIAERLGADPYQLVAVDLNSDLHAEAKARATARGLQIHWGEVDLNFVDIPENTFDVIYAHAALHHLLNLEHVFEHIARGLKPDGRFVMLDLIGKAEVLFWPENLEAAVELVRQMPEAYKPGIGDPYTVVAPYTHAYVGTEGIRQEEIPIIATSWLDPIKAFSYNSVVRIICTHPVIGNALDPADTEHRRYLEQLFEYDLEMIREKRLRPTEMFAVFKKKS